MIYGWWEATCPANGFVLIEGKGVEISFRRTKMTIKVSSDNSEGRYSLIEMVHPQNIGPALHIHPAAPEAYYILEGDYLIKYSNEVSQVTRGDFVFISKGVPHNYQSGANGGRVLVISPAGLEKYFQEVADKLKHGPITWELEQEIARRYGQQFLEHLKHWGQ